MQKVLGIDLGVNSIGWALFEGLNEEQAPQALIDGGVRIFDAGVENLGKGEQEVTRNKERRENRGLRRQTFRWRLRRDKLKRWLIEHQWVDAPYIDETLRFTAAFKTADPYQLRYNALHQRLERWELARIMVHLCQRRGFKSNRKFVTDDEDENKGAIYKGSTTGTKDNKVVLIKGINDTKAEWEASGLKTIGAYLFSLKGKPNERQRARFTLRSWFIEEFDAIWQAQQSHHPDILTEENRKVLRDQILFFQRRLRSQSDRIGKCTFEQNEKRVPLSHPYNEAARLWQDLNNLSFEGKNYKQTREIHDLLYKKDNDGNLPKRQIDREKSDLFTDALKEIFETLRTSQKEIDPKTIWKKFFQKRVGETLNIDHDEVVCNLSKSSTSVKKIKGLVTEQEIRKALDNRDLSESEVIDIFKRLYGDPYYLDADELDDEQFIAWLMQELNITEAQAKALKKIPFARKYGSLSELALAKILPNLEKGMMYSQACAEVGYHHSHFEAPELQRLLPPVKPDEIRNPIVIAALVQLRKVVNGIIKRYGKIDVIKIELSRDLKQNKAQRELDAKKNKANAEFNQKVLEELQAVFSRHRIQRQPVRKDIIKYKLFCEQGGTDRGPATCIYSGKTIDVTELFNDESGIWNVDHIIPYSKRPVDSISNLVLCHRDANEEKRNRLPHEWLSGDESRYEAVLDRARRFYRPNEELKTANSNKGKNKKAQNQDPDPEPQTEPATTEKDSKNKSYGDSDYFTRKFEKFKLTHVDELIGKDGEEGFIDRQLNDTRYMSRLAKDYLKQICKDVQAVQGQTTAKLRQSWGLQQRDESDPKKPFLSNFALDNVELHESELMNGGKSRLDHRHHFIDACVIACTTRSMIQHLSTHRGRTGSLDGTKSFPKPFESFTQDVKHHLDNIMVSFRIKRRPQGALHDQTLYGLLKNPDGTPMTNEEGDCIYAVRKELAFFTDEKKINKIVDDEVRQAVLERFKAHGGDAKKAFAYPLPHPKSPFPIKKVRIKVVMNNAIPLRKDEAGNNYVYVEPGRNHHACIYSRVKILKGGKTKTEREDVIVSLFEAARRKAQKQPIIQRDHKANEGWLFVTSLMTNEMFLLFDSQTKRDNFLRTFDFNNKKQYKQAFKHLYRVQKMSKGDYFFRFHSMAKISLMLKPKDESGKGSEESKKVGLKRISDLDKLVGIKVSVTPDGYLIKLGVV